MSSTYHNSVDDNQSYKKNNDWKNIAFIEYIVSWDDHSWRYIVI